MSGCFLWVAFMCMCIYFGGWAGLIVGIGFSFLLMALNT